MIAREEIIEWPRLGLESPGIRIGDVGDVPGLDVPERLRPHLVESREVAGAIRLEVVGIVIARHPRIAPVPPVNRRLTRRLLDAIDVALEIRIAARQVDKDPIEAVALLQLHQRVREHLRAIPDVERGATGIQEVVTDCQLTEHRHAIGLPEVHGDPDAFPAVHADSVWICHLRGWSPMTSGARSASTFNMKLCHGRLPAPESPPL